MQMVAIQTVMLAEAIAVFALKRGHLTLFVVFEALIAGVRLGMVVTALVLMGLVGLVGLVGWVGLRRPTKETGKGLWLGIAPFVTGRRLVEHLWGGLLDPLGRGRQEVEWLTLSGATGRGEQRGQSRFK